MFCIRRETQDEAVAEEVLLKNQYKLPEKMSGTVIDIGAHIGSFAVACLVRGADRVVCFEPCPENFALLRENLSGYGDKAVLVNKPVWRSDVSEEIGFAPGENGATACGMVLPLGGGVLGVGLDQIIAEHGPVGYLKIDAEGSEYPILYTSKRLKEVGFIAGETHTLLGPDDGTFSLVPKAFCNKDRLFDFLAASGFTVTATREAADNDLNALFWAEANRGQPTVA